jgi:hypothetical protein
VRAADPIVVAPAAHDRQSDADKHADRADCSEDRRQLAPHLRGVWLARSNAAASPAANEGRTPHAHGWPLGVYSQRTDRGIS